MRVATYTFGQEPTNFQLFGPLPSIWQWTDLSPAVTRKLDPHVPTPNVSCAEAKRALAEAPVASNLRPGCLSPARDLTTAQSAKSATNASTKRANLSLKQAKRREKHRGYYARNAPHLGHFFD